MPTQISLRGITLSRGDRLLLGEVSFAVWPGERVAIVGEIPAARPRERLLSAFGCRLPGTPREQAALLLSYGLFRPDDLHVPVGSLSAGQRRRLTLARPVDLLLLDEPTNYLALGLVEQLEEALAQWTGALVVVSRDRLLRSRFTGRRCEMRAGRPMAEEGGEASATPSI